MADPHGFLNTRERITQTRRPVPVRIMDWKEVYEAQEKGVLKSQAGRCMDCGVAFCHQGCPLGNLIPEWNDLTWRDKGQEAVGASALHEQLPGVHRPPVPGTL